jgi:hypothetical protein
MTAFRRKLNESQPYSIVYGSYHGASFSQAGRYFDGEKLEIAIPGQAALPDLPSPVDQAARLAELMAGGTTLIAAASMVQAEVDEYEAALKAATSPSRRALASVTRAPVEMTVPPVSDLPVPPAPPPPDGASGRKDQKAVPVDDAGRPVWEWGWNEMLTHCKEIGIDRPQNREACIITLKAIYDLAS